MGMREYFCDRLRFILSVLGNYSPGENVHSLYLGERGEGGRGGEKGEGVG